MDRRDNALRRTGQEGIDQVFAFDWFGLGAAGPFPIGPDPREQESGRDLSFKDVDIFCVFHDDERPSKLR
jgi:hypothetical protein